MTPLFKSEIKIKGRTEGDNVLVMASGKQINLGVGCDDPKPIIFPLEAIHGRPLVQVPHPDGLILARRKNQVLVRVEKTATSVLEVSPASINLPLA
jgi:hypothetical protein